MSDLWAFLGDPANRAILAWLGGGLVVLAGGGWTVVQFFAGRERSKGTAPAPVPTTVRADRGSIAGGRDVSVQTSHGLSGLEVILLVLVVIGGVLLAGGLFGQHITAINSAATGGSIQNSTVTINGGSGSAKP